jgi:hypothetical protein
VAYGLGIAGARVVKPCVGTRGVDLHLGLFREDELRRAIAGVGSRLSAGHACWSRSSALGSNIAS